MKVLNWIVGLPLAVLLVMFAVANRREVTVELWPLPWSMDLPLYLAVMAPLTIGLLAGAAITWLSGAPARRRAREQRRRAVELERQLAEMQPKITGPQ
ncbi:MAG: lipopolysaccharide assembly protein LapA domain-containing protein [Actinomycetota bacterium]